MPTKPALASVMVLPRVATDHTGRWHGCYAFKHRYAAQHARVETRHGPAKGLVIMLAADRRGPAGSDLIPNGCMRGNCDPKTNDPAFPLVRSLIVGLGGLGPPASS
jgi:hypothetical protein